MKILEQVNLKKLIEIMMHYSWQRECEIIKDYESPHEGIKDRFKGCVIQHTPTKSFLRYSHGPQTGVFWDIYGDDFHSVELALCELAKAPSPHRAAGYPISGSSENFPIE